MPNIKDKSSCYGCRCETCRWKGPAGVSVGGVSMDKTMNLREIIAYLRDQARDKESLDDGENGIFARDMEVLMIAAEALERLEAAMEIFAWVPGGEKEKSSAAKRIRLMDAFDMLSEREKKVLIMLDGLDGTPQPMSAVGKEFGVTRERIRQLADRAHAKLTCAISDDSVADLLRECAREIMVSEKQKAFRAEATRSEEREEDEHDTGRSDCRN